MDIKDSEDDQYWAKYSNEEEIPMKIFHTDRIVGIHDT